MPPLSNAERQRRFRELKSLEQQLKADAWDWFIASVESRQSDVIPLIDGRKLKVEARKGETRVELVDDAQAQSDILRARLRRIHED